MIKDIIKCIIYLDTNYIPDNIDDIINSVKKLRNQPIKQVLGNQSLDLFYLRIPNDILTDDLILPWYKEHTNVIEIIEYYMNIQNKIFHKMYTPEIITFYRYIPLPTMWQKYQYKLVTGKNK